MKKTLALLAALAVLLTVLAGCGADGKSAEEKASAFFDSLEDKLDQVEESLNELDDKLNGAADEQTAAPEATEAPQTAEPALTEAPQASEPAEAPAEAEAAPPGDGDIRPEIKEAIDSYEDFFNEYADFMESYDASDLSAMTGYLSMMTQYAETMQKLDDMENADLTSAELDYYMQAVLRIDQRLLEATGSAAN